MAIETLRITASEAVKLVRAEEGQFVDVKAIDIAPAKLTRTISAFANADGGDLYIGIDEPETGKVATRRWRGFAGDEAANGHLQAFESLFPLGTNYCYEFLKCDGNNGILLHVQVNKSQAVVRASNEVPYLRRGASNQPIDTPEKLRRLEYAKGITSFENEGTNVDKIVVTGSTMIGDFIKEVVPKAKPEDWLKKQLLIQGDRPTVAGVLLFADEPQALIPKRCGIKLYRYRTREAEGSRESLAFTPKTIEGCLYKQIRSAVAETTQIVESIPRMGDESLEAIKYPPDTLHEIITNAVLHRDYSVADDVHIRIFDNRIEVQSPGRLPAHITVSNILAERFARNGAIVRILNKFPDAPNKDVGEGLNTAFEAMHSLGLKEPSIEELDNAVLVKIKHESLASPEEAIMEFLETHDTIRNSEARKVTHVRADYQIKSIFGRMVEKKMIEQVPGTRTSNTQYRRRRQKSSSLRS